MSREFRYGAIEAGGTKVVCAWADGDGNILESRRIATTTPERVISEVTQFFLSVSGSGATTPQGVGIAAFGPVQLDAAAPDYGSLLKTPKKGWEGANWAMPMRTLFPSARVVVETDVNAAALGEIRWGAARGLRDVVYFTIGTGIGAGIIANGQPLHGLVHPEAGHMRIPRSEAEKKQFPGVCRFHGDCLEGLASGPAIQARWGAPGEELGSHHEAWTHVADALAWACVNMVVTVSPRRIVIGGGVSQAPRLIPKIRTEVLARLNGYVHVPEIMQRIDEFIVPPGLGQQSGIKGALALVLP